MFRGSFEHTLDNKGRLSIPSKFRDVLIGKGDERIIYVTIGYRLVQLNARTGQPIATFGKGGMVDLKEGVVYGKLVNGQWQQVPIPLVEGEIAGRRHSGRGDRRDDDHPGLNCCSKGAGW